MATVYYIGQAQARAAVRRVVVGGVPAAGNTARITVTGSGKFVEYLLVTGDTIASVVTALLALWAASPDPEVTEIAAAANAGAPGTTIDFTGPADGATVVITSTVTGGGVTLTDSSIVTETGPHHANNTANYSTGALPAGGGADTLEFAAGRNGPKYALTALAAIDLAGVTRRPEFTGQVGLTEFSPNGYLEYRVKFLQLNTPVLTWAQTPDDSEQQFRVETVTTAVALQSTGTDPSRSAGPVLEVTGLVATSTVNIASASVGLSYRAGQVSGPNTIEATASTLFTGPGCTATGAVTLSDTTAELWGNAASFTFNGQGSQVETRGSCAATGAAGTKVNGGTLTVRSTGDLTGSGTVMEVRGGAVLDLNEAPALVATMAIVASAGATINNAAGRITTTFTITPDGCRFVDIFYTGPPNEVHTMS